MLIVIGMAALAMAAQDSGQWQDFGAGPDGARVSLNLDSVESGDQGPEAMVRVLYARPAAGGAMQADIRSVFDCSGRSVSRFLMGQLNASGEIVARTDEGEPMEAVRAPAGTPLGKVLDLVCEMAAG